MNRRETNEKDVKLQKLIERNRNLIDINVNDIAVSLREQFSLQMTVESSRLSDLPQDSSMRQVQRQTMNGQDTETASICCCSYNCA